MNAAGIVIILAGVWLIAQVLGGKLLQRLGAV